MLLMLAGTNSRTYLNKHIALATGLLSMYDLLLSKANETNKILPFVSIETLSNNSELLYKYY